MSVYNSESHSLHKFPYPPDHRRARVQKAIARRNALRHAWRILLRESIPIPHALWVQMYEAGEAVERIRDEYCGSTEVA